MRRFIARHFPVRGGGRSSLPDRDLSINLSLVLHERSDSQAVESAMRAIRSRAHAMSPSRTLRGLGVDDDVDLWLVPSLGLPENVEDVPGINAPVMLVDSGLEPRREATFFRAPARLTLPGNDPLTVGAAAYVQRPGKRTTQVITRGPFNWPDDRDRVLREIEALIQSHVEQWNPGVQLWQGPAEEILPEFR